MGFEAYNAIAKPTSSSRIPFRCTIVLSTGACAVGDVFGFNFDASMFHLFTLLFRDSPMLIDDFDFRKSPNSLGISMSSVKFAVN